MNRDEALKLLSEHKATLAQRFGVVNLALFGSIVRNRATDNRRTKRTGEKAAA